MPREITDRGRVVEAVQNLSLTAELFEEQNGKQKYATDLEVIVQGRDYGNGKRVGPYIRLLSYDAGEEIMRQGEWGGNTFYIAVEGALDVYVREVLGPSPSPPEPPRAQPGCPFKGNVIVGTDGDDARDGAALVVGRRTPRRDPPHRLAFALVYSMLMRVLFGVAVRDVHSVKLYRADALRAAWPTSTRPAERPWPRPRRDRRARFGSVLTSIVSHHGCAATSARTARSTRRSGRSSPRRARIG